MQTPWLGITVQQVDLTPDASAMFEGQETALVVQSVNEGSTGGSGRAHNG